MKIIFGRDTFAIERHAKKIVRGLEAQEEAYPNRAIPKGIAHHLTRYPYLCDDCGEQYWAKSEWASHLGCPGVPSKQEKGFGFKA